MKVLHIYSKLMRKQTWELKFYLREESLHAKCKTFTYKLGAFGFDIQSGIKLVLNQSSPLPEWQFRSVFHALKGTTPGRSLSTQEARGKEASLGKWHAESDSS